MRAVVAVGVVAVVALSLAALLAGCPGPATSTSRSTSTSTKKFGPKGLPCKIGIMTGTVAQGEDEYRAAEAVVRAYGAEAVTHVTYPDNFMSESEQTISLLKGLADDPDVKAIVVAQAVPGSIPAIKKIKASRPDVVFILNTPHEDPDQVAKYADLAITEDELRRGETIVQVARRLGAKTFIHYSFPRHMSQKLLAERRDLMQKKCAELGLRFESVNAPDPMGDQGLPGAQKFVQEDVPRKVEQHGKDTAFFSTNCGMQEPLIQAAIGQGAIVPEQCCPSPTHGYPGALGIKIDESMAGDMAKIRQAISAKVKEKGGAGRFATWPVSMSITLIQASTELAVEAASKGAGAIRDPAVVKAAIEKAGGVTVDVRPLGAGAGSYLLVIADSVVF